MVTITATATAANILLTVIGTPSIAPTTAIELIITRTITPITATGSITNLAGPINPILTITELIMAITATGGATGVDPHWSTHTS